MNSNENGDYFENKPTLKIENIYSEETFKNVGNENGENFEQDDRTNLKIEEHVQCIACKQSQNDF